MLKLKAAKLDECNTVYPLEDGGLRIVRHRRGFKDRVIELDKTAVMALRVLLVWLEEQKSGRDSS
jgi:hypothetical protein